MLCDRWMTCATHRTPGSRLRSSGTHQKSTCRALLRPSKAMKPYIQLSQHVVCSQHVVTACCLFLVVPNGTPCALVSYTVRCSVLSLLSNPDFNS